MPKFSVKATNTTTRVQRSLVTITMYEYLAHRSYKALSLAPTRLMKEYFLATMSTNGRLLGYFAIFVPIYPELYLFG